MSAQPSKEYVEYMARQMELKLTGEELGVLEQVVQANEEYLVVVDATTRTPAEDPLGFMRFVRNWRQLDDE